jgi:dethiobiotin synthetase
MPHQDANMATLKARLQAPLLAHWPWDADADPADLARSLRLP